MIDNINWYPGHMKKTRELIAANLKLVDAVIEVVDARIPVSSRNPIIDELTAGKTRIIAFNKSDLSDPVENDRWIAHYLNQDITAIPLNSNRGDGIDKMINTLNKVETKGGRACRIMTVGVPNVGKSSLINRLTRKKSTKVGDKPGVTKGKQWLTLDNGMMLLDTPGILWPKFEDPEVGLNLAFCGSIKDEILDTQDLAFELIKVLERDYPEKLIERFKLDEIADDTLANMEAIAVKRGFILPGKRIDYERTGRTVLDEFRSGQIGRITLEKADD